MSHFSIFKLQNSVLMLSYVTSLHLISISFSIVIHISLCLDFNYCLKSTALGECEHTSNTCSLIRITDNTSIPHVRIFLTFMMLLTLSFLYFLRIESSFVLTFLLLLFALNAVLWLNCSQVLLMIKCFYLDSLIELFVKHFADRTINTAVHSYSDTVLLRLSSTFNRCPLSNSTSACSLVLTRHQFK